MNRIVLRRLADGAVEARESTDDGTAVGASRLPADQVPALVRDREREPVRWVWDDTTRWYPQLLDAGVRVERCTDLRLAHAVLRRSPFVDQALLAGDDVDGWDALQPVTAAGSGEPAGGPRTAGGGDPDGVRRARAEPRLAGRAAAGPPGGGPAGERHPVVDAGAARASRRPGPARVQEAVAAAAGQRLELARHLGPRRAVPLVLPPGWRGDRAVGLQRRGSAVGADPGAPRRGRRRGLAVRGGRRRPAGAARARRHERRHRDGGGGAVDRPLPGHGRLGCGGDAGRG